MSDELTERELADKNLRRAMEYRADCAGQLESAKDRIAHHTGELVKAERLAERMEAERPAADEAVREAFDFYRYAMEKPTAAGVSDRHEERETGDE